MGTGSNEVGKKRGGYLVYAMEISEILETNQYWEDPRFECKKPDMHHNWVTASGDNIYEPIGPSKWNQLNSYHSMRDGQQHAKHTIRDTGVTRVLISDYYIYYGGSGPKLPDKFLPEGEMVLCHAGPSYRRFWDEKTIKEFIDWLRARGHHGYEGKPWDWIHRRKCQQLFRTRGKGR